LVNQSPMSARPDRLCMSSGCAHNATTQRHNATTPPSLPISGRTRASRRLWPAPTATPPRRRDGRRDVLARPGPWYRPRRRRESQAAARGGQSRSQPCGLRRSVPSSPSLLVSDAFTSGNRPSGPPGQREKTTRTARVCAPCSPHSEARPKASHSQSVHHSRSTPSQVTPCEGQTAHPSPRTAPGSNFGG